MMYFTTHLATYQPKNRACHELSNWVGSYKHILIENESALENLKKKIEKQVKAINLKYPKVKEIYLSCGDKRNFSIRAYVKSNGVSQEIFILNYVKVNGFYSYTDDPSAMQTVIPFGKSQQEGGSHEG